MVPWRFWSAFVLDYVTFGHCMLLRRSLAGLKHSTTKWIRFLTRTIAFTKPAGNRVREEVLHTRGSLRLGTGHTTVTSSHMFRFIHNPVVRGPNNKRSPASTINCWPIEKHYGHESDTLALHVYFCSKRIAFSPSILVCMFSPCFRGGS